MQIHVDHVETHVAGAHLAENGVEIGAVVVQQTTGVVNDARDLLDAPLEHTERRRVGQHDARGLRAHRRAQRFEIGVAVDPDRHFVRDAAAHGRGRRIGAMRGLRHDDLGACQIAA